MTTSYFKNLVIVVAMLATGSPLLSLAASFFPLESRHLNVANTGIEQVATPSHAQLQLKWELMDNFFQTPNAHGKSRAVFTLTNTGSAALSETGWALYFNCIDGVETGHLNGNLALEQVVGTLFRLVPVAGFQGLASGRTLRAEYFHPDPNLKGARIPSGPYIVFDDAPDKGYAITDYTVAPIEHAAQSSRGRTAPGSMVTPEDIYRQNEKIQDLANDAIPPIFPTPLNLRRRKGALHLVTMPRVTGDSALRGEIALATEILRPYLSARALNEGIEPGIHLQIGSVKGQQSPDAYELLVDGRRGITLTGNSVAGVFYGLQSLRDILPLRPEPKAGLDLPLINVVDSPRFGYRGFHLDVARNFQSKETVLKILDLMARYKLNKFHFHLTDDEGWRLEIPSIPELTSIGGRRGHAVHEDDLLPPAYGSGPDVNDQYGSGHYSRQEYIEILKYAAVRHIDVIPEIEMPGHARAAVMAMESRFRRLAKIGDPSARLYLLNDLEDRSEYKSPQLYTDHVMNPGLPSTYVFIECVVADIAAIYKDAGVPLHTIHVGGDELPVGAWEKSPAGIALMKEKGLTSTSDLWDYFYDRVDQILRRHQLFTSGWEELGMRRVKLAGVWRAVPNRLFVDRGFQLTVWNNAGDNAEDLAYRLANAGYQTVLAPVTNFYFDMAYNKDPEEVGVSWGGYIDLDTIYDFIPLDYYKNSILPRSRFVGKAHLTKYGQDNIVGLEACLWTETIRGEGRLDYLMMPRLLGLAERAWAPDPAWAQEPDTVKAEAMHSDAWSGFVNALGKRVLPRLDVENTGWAYRIPPPGLKLENGQVYANHQLPGFTLRYSNDDSEPTNGSMEISGHINAKGVIRVAAFNRYGRSGRSSRVENQ